MHSNNDVVTELRALAREAKAYQDERGWTDTKLCQEISHLGSTKTYKRILDENDPLDELNLERQLTNYRAGIELINARRATDRPTELEYADFNNVLTTMNAVTRAIAEPSDSIDRLVIVQGFTGTGKDTAKRAMLKRWPKITLEIEADELWRHSVNVPLAEMLNALTIRRRGEEGEDGQKQEFKMPNMPDARQALLIEELRKRKLVLLINEAHRMGPRGLNLITTLINKTPSVIVLFCIPTLITRLVGSAYEEAVQLIGNRLNEAVTLPTPAPEEILEMCERRGVKFADAQASDAAGKRIATEAPRYGNWAFVKQVVRECRAKGNGKLTLEQFTAAMSAALAKRLQVQRRAA